MSLSHHICNTYNTIRSFHYLLDIIFLRLIAHIHLTINLSAISNLCTSSDLIGQVSLPYTISLCAQALYTFPFTFRKAPQKFNTGATPWILLHVLCICELHAVYLIVSPNSFLQILPANFAVFSTWPTPFLHLITFVFPIFAISPFSSIPVLCLLICCSNRTVKMSVNGRLYSGRMQSQPLLPIDN